MRTMLKNFDRSLSQFAKQHAFTMLRLSLGLIFLWFGAVKLVPGLSPAEALATNTIQILTFHLFSDEVIRIGLGVWESLIGICYFFPKTTRLAVYLMLPQMAGTFTPLFLFPEAIFIQPPFGLSIEGQYIVKNILIIAAGLTLLGRVSPVTESTSH